MPCQPLSRQQLPDVQLHQQHHQRQQPAASPSAAAQLTRSVRGRSTAHRCLLYAWTAVRCGCAPPAACCCARIGKRESVNAHRLMGGWAAAVTCIRSTHSGHAGIRHSALGTARVQLATTGCHAIFVPCVMQHGKLSKLMTQVTHVEGPQLASHWQESRWHCTRLINQFCCNKSAQVLQQARVPAVGCPCQRLLQLLQQSWRHRECSSGFLCTHCAALQAHATEHSSYWGGIKSGSVN
jgi:hypothetical protein